MLFFQDLTRREIESLAKKNPKELLKLREDGTLSDPDTVDAIKAIKDHMSMTERVTYRIYFLLNFNLIEDALHGFTWDTFTPTKFIVSILYHGMKVYNERVQMLRRMAIPV